MHIHIANGTHQVQEFNYRLIEAQKLRQVPIPIGGQVRLSDNLSQRDIDYVVGQHAPYGLVKADEIDRAPKTKLITMCYSVDKAVDADYIRKMIFHNEIVLGKRGDDMRQKTAVAINNTLEQQTKELGTLNETMVSVVEEDADKNPHAGDPVAAGVIVDRRQETSLKPSKAKNARRAQG